MKKIRKTKVRDPRRYNELIDKYAVKHDNIYVTWDIINPDKAKELGLDTVKSEETGRSYLILNVSQIPNGMSLNDFLGFIVEEGIVLKKTL